MIIPISLMPAKTSSKPRSRKTSPTPRTEGRGGELRIVGYVGIALMAAALGTAGLVHSRAPQPTAAPETLEVSRSQDSEFRITSELAGPNGDWIFHLYESVPELAASSIAQIIAQADASSRFRLIYANPEARHALEGELAKLGFQDERRLFWILSPIPIAPWPRDQFVVGRGADFKNVLFLSDPSHYAAMYRAIGTHYSEAIAALGQAIPGVRLVETLARVEGGSLVADDERVFMSPRPLRLMVDSGKFPNAHAARASLEETYGRPVEVLRMPKGFALEHADLVLTPAPNRTLVLADPRLGADLLASAPEAERRAFVAEIAKLASHRAPGDPIRRIAVPEVIDTLISANRGPDKQAAFEDIEAQLSDLGYRIERVPFLLLPVQEFEAVHVFSWNNAVQERRGTVRTVYLPRYGLPTLDQAAASTWRDLGYRVIQIDTLGPGLLGGSVRCLSQQLRMLRPAT